MSNVPREGMFIRTHPPAMMGMAMSRGAYRTPLRTARSNSGFLALGSANSSATMASGLSSSISRAQILSAGYSARAQRTKPHNPEWAVWIGSPLITAWVCCVTSRTLGRGAVLFSPIWTTCCVVRSTVSMTAFCSAATCNPERTTMPFHGCPSTRARGGRVERTQRAAESLATTDAATGHSSSATMSHLWAGASAATAPAGTCSHSASNTTSAGALDAGCLPSPPIGRAQRPYRDITTLPSRLRMWMSATASPFLVSASGSSFTWARMTPAPALVTTTRLMEAGTDMVSSRPAPTAAAVASCMAPSIRAGNTLKSFHWLECDCSVPMAWPPPTLMSAKGRNSGPYCNPTACRSAYSFSTSSTLVHTASKSAQDSLAGISGAVLKRPLTCPVS
mmetsp:Transcript_103490/g.178310  ORF Transcript_103490/g.178310 Transcript_103490/m.178310 type:complete len:392 (+) Transcript_103490:8303-9478(+)